MGLAQSHSSIGFLLFLSPKEAKKKEKIINGLSYSAEVNRLEAAKDQLFLRFQ